MSVGTKLRASSPSPSFAGTTRPLRVLCLDIEGGHGGSSRSLEVALRHIDRAHVEPEVWTRLAGPIHKRYAALGIATQVCPAMPKVSALPRSSRSALAFGRFSLRDWPASIAFRHQLAEAAERVDLVHCNHEALFLLAGWLRAARPHLPITAHVRTNLHATLFARWQSRRLVRATDGIVFITENERQTLLRDAGCLGRYAVIANPVEIEATDPPAPLVPPDGRFQVACLSNFSFGRGVDRLVEIACALSPAGRKRVVFVVAGDMTLSRSLPGLLGTVARRGGILADVALAKEVASSFVFLGHVPEPRAVLASADLVIKPTREANPWGRDVLEAMSEGKPTLSVGTFDRFVETGVTGTLLAEFDPIGAARAIEAYAGDPARCRREGEAARRRVFELCDPVARSADLADFWHEVVAGRLRPV